MSGRPVLRSACDPAREAFKRNAAANERARRRAAGKRLAAARLGGGERSRARHAARGKLLPRDRVDTLLDPGSPFLELAPLAADGMYGGAGPGRRGDRRDRPGQRPRVRDRRQRRHGQGRHVLPDDGQEAPAGPGGGAARTACPCLYLVDSGGAFLPMQDEVFPDREHFGRIFYNQATDVRRRHPADRRRARLLHGGRRVRPGDERRGRDRPQPGHDLPGRPAAGEGGDRRGRHAPRSSAAARCTPASRASPTTSPRTTRTRCGSSATSSPPSRRAAPLALGASTPAEEPKVDPCGLYGVVPVDSAHALRRTRGHRPGRRRQRASRSSRPSTARRWSPASPGSTATRSGSSPTTASCSPSRAQKGAHFIELCDQRGIPLVFLQNISGFMVGRDYEAGGIAKHGAKMVTAVACARVPKLTVVVGGSYGAGNYSMCGRAYSPRFLWMWPNAKISVMGGEQAASVLATVKRDQSRRAARSAPRTRRPSRPRSARSTRRRATPTTRPPGSGTTA